MNVARISTHVLDTSAGKPAAGIQVDLYRVNSTGREHLKTAITNADGRTDEPLLSSGTLDAGAYEIVFAAGAYFGLSSPAFLEEVVIRFGVADPASHYHVPLLLSPFGYTTYRGS